MVDYDTNLKQKRHIHNPISLKLLFARIDVDHQHLNEGEATRKNGTGHTAYSILHRFYG
jgi:hypothetical protein